MTARHYYATVDPDGTLSEVWSSPVPLERAPAPEVTEEAAKIGSRLATVGGEDYYFDKQAVEVRQKRTVRILPEAPSKDRTKGPMKVRIEGDQPVTVLVNGKHRVSLKAGEDLDLEWDRAAVVSIELVDDPSIRAERVHVRFDEPPPPPQPQPVRNP